MKTDNQRPDLLADYLNVKLYINRPELLPDTHDLRYENKHTNSLMELSGNLPDRGDHVIVRL